MWKHLALPVLLSLPLWTLAETSAPGKPTTAVYPIEAQLIHALNASHIKVGDRVLAKIDHEWTYAQCRLPAGSVISGRVTELSTPTATSKLSSVALAFAADCGEAGAQPLTWIAVLARDENPNANWHDGKPVLVGALRSSSFGETSGLPGPVPNQSSPGDMSGRQAPNLPLFPADDPVDHSHPRPSAVKTGEVWRLPNLSLSVASGPQGSTILFSSKKDLHLERGAVLVLSPTTGAYVGTGAGAGATPSPHTVPPHREVQPPVDETEICAASTCSIALSTTVSEKASAATKSVLLAGLGYRPRLVAELTDFDYDAAVTYLGPAELLFTFNPHSLIPRTNDERLGSHFHMVRAVLINLTTSAVERTVDWRVADGKQYLWPVHNNRVLVHIGGQLKIFGSGLREQAKFDLAGPLAFVTYSPDQKHFAVGVVHELHTRELHSELERTTTGDPEEEVETTLLNDKLEGKAVTKQSSRFRGPVLSDHGEIVLARAGATHWKLKEANWNGQTSTLVQLGSSCTPELTSLTGGLLFVIGCDNNGVGRWYRVLRVDGSPVLKGSSLVRDMKPIALADDAGDAFALTMRRGNSVYVSGDPFHGTDIESQSVKVYRAKNGEKLLAAKIQTPTPTWQTVAFAPGGAQMAVLDGEKISIFNVVP